MSVLEPTTETVAVVTTDAVALGAFVESHYPRLVRLAALVCDEASDAQDAVQAGLERAWRKRSGLRQPDRLSAWLDRIVVREAIRVSRKRRSWQARRFSPVREIEVDIADTRSAGAPRDEWLDLRIAFAQLSADHRAVIALHLYGGYSVVETADFVGAPIETVRSRLRVARERLRTALGEASR